MAFFEQVKEEAEPRPPAAAQLEARRGGKRAAGRPSPRARERERLSRKRSSGALGGWRRRWRGGWRSASSGSTCCPLAWASSRTAISIWGIALATSETIAGATSAGSRRRFRSWRLVGNFGASVYPLAQRLNVAKWIGAGIFDVLRIGGAIHAAVNYQSETAMPDRPVMPSPLAAPPPEPLPAPTLPPGVELNQAPRPGRERPAPQPGLACAGASLDAHGDTCMAHFIVRAARRATQHRPAGQGDAHPGARATPTCCSRGARAGVDQRSGTGYAATRSRRARRVAGRRRTLADLLAEGKTELLLARSASSFRQRGLPEHAGPPSPRTTARRPAERLADLAAHLAREPSLTRLDLDPGTDRDPRWSAPTRASSWWSKMARRGCRRRATSASRTSPTWLSWSAIPIVAKVLLYTKTRLIVSDAGNDAEFNAGLGQRGEPQV